ncbi:hypothetical protein OCK74_10425 [Chitinophagaceae bacterium LB-8]|jgi:hypothetical protein|uniref:Uncharacterized protein n=1 Tax=Paraflavisolibacter caeni TaxID=2982496 RepID=A0A9X3BHF6_9BACT|nr:hypothetical protein [Paraflavisolibacter caeni]MCU7549532.1 hypothetical protein [Paraflavisolibacter caeni]
MNSTIRTYEDLLKEQQRLIGIIKTQEELIRKDIAGVKEGLKPFNKVARQINNIATRDNTAPLMNFGLEFGVDLLLRKFILARSGWFTKIIIPFLVKNYSSHIIGEETRLFIFQKVRNFFQKIRPHASPEAYATSEAPPASGMQEKQDDFTARTSDLFKDEESRRDT